jgi:hypothetical protein
MKQADKDFHGVADCYGIESFVPFDTKHYMPLLLRAQLNRQRHAIYYRAVLTERDVRAIRGYIKRRHFMQALDELKKRAVVFKVPTDMVGSIELIPDEKLDPYRAIGK